MNNLEPLTEELFKEVVDNWPHSSLAYEDIKHLNAGDGFCAISQSHEDNILYRGPPVDIWADWVRENPVLVGFMDRLQADNGELAEDIFKEAWAQGYGPWDLGADVTFIDDDGISHGYGSDRKVSNGV